jgi:hypothetical protein
MAYCANCGTEISEQAPACPKCGHPQHATQGYGRTEGTAIVALVLGILSIVMWPLALVLGIPAIIVGTQARNRIREDPALQGEGLARAGVITGWVGIGLGVLFIAGIVTAIVFGVHSSGYHSV